MSALTRTLWRLDLALREISNRLEERRFDRRHGGIRTAGVQALSAEARRRPAFAGAQRYQGVPTRRFELAVALLGIDPSQTTFIDLGCGKGRALAIAAAHGFRRVIGVEFDPELVAEARRNVARVAAVTGTPIEVVDGDAGEYAIPAEPTLVFVYNPFGPAVMARVVANVERSAAEHGGPVHVLYMYANQPEPWRAAPTLVEVPLPPAVTSPPPLRLFRGLIGHQHGCELPLLAFTAQRPAVS